MRERHHSKLVTKLTLAVMGLVAACSSDSPTSVLDRAAATVPGIGVVDDLTVSETSGSSVTLAWTGVANGEGDPAAYLVEYSESSGDWTAVEDCDGAPRVIAVGARVTCTVTGLTALRDYAFRVASFELDPAGRQSARYSNIAMARTKEPSAGAVTDLTVKASTASSITVRWTQVDDGLGQPASYRVRFGEPPFEWSTGTAGCSTTVTGTEVGAPMSCTIEGLSASTSYDVQLMAFRLRNDAWEGAVPSNVAHATTAASGEAAAGAAPGIWVDRARVMQLPIAGVAWERVLADAASDPGKADIADQDSNHDVYTLAAALTCVRARLHCEKARKGVLDAIGTEAGARWLAVGRNLGAYVIAADLLNLRSDGNPNSEGTRVQTWIASWLTKRVYDNNTSVLRRLAPFATSANASAQEGFAFVAVAAYLRDRSQLDRAWEAFRTFVCDPGARDVEHIDLVRPVRDGWAHDDRAPCAINPAGARKTVPPGLPGAGGTYRIDGALIGDMRRGGVFQWRPGYTSYPWVGLEGVVPAAVVLQRAGYPAFEIADKAVLRTHDYLWQLRNATGEADWFDGTRSREIVQLVNAYYGASFPVNDVAAAGRTVGYTSWTHATWR